MAKVPLTTEQAEIKMMKKEKTASNFRSFVAVVLAIAITAGVVYFGKTTAGNKITTVTQSVAPEINDDGSGDFGTQDPIIDSETGEPVVDESGEPATDGEGSTPSDAPQKEEEKAPQRELPANPAEWTKAEAVDYYKKAAAKSHASVQSSQKMILHKLEVKNSGLIGSFLNAIKPIIDTVIKNNAITYGGVTGGYTKLTVSDVKTIKSYKEGKYTIIEMTMVEQTDGIYGDFQGGSVGHAINVLGNVATAVEQFPMFDIKFEEADIKVHYTKPTVKVRINENGIIEKGTWSYYSKIYIRDLDISGIMVKQADADIEYIIVIGGGF